MLPGATRVQGRGGTTGCSSPSLFALYCRKAPDMAHVWRVHLTRSGHSVCACVLGPVLVCCCLESCVLPVCAHARACARVWACVRACKRRRLHARVCVHACGKQRRVVHAGPHAFAMHLFWLFMVPEDQTQPLRMYVPRASSTASERSSVSMNTSSGPREHKTIKTMIVTFCHKARRLPKQNIDTQKHTIWTHTHTHTHAHTHTYTHTHTHAHAHAHTHASTHTSLHTRRHVHMPAQQEGVRTGPHILTHARTYVRRRLSLPLPSLHASLSLPPLTMVQGLFAAVTAAATGAPRPPGTAHARPIGTGPTVPSSAAWRTARRKRCECVPASGVLSCAVAVPYSSNGRQQHPINVWRR